MGVTEGVRTHVKGKDLLLLTGALEVRYGNAMPWMIPLFLGPDILLWGSVRLRTKINPTNPVFELYKI